jgi:hypothetical protein
VPKECRRYSDERAIREFCFTSLNGLSTAVSTKGEHDHSERTYRDSSLVHNDFMIACSDKASGEVFQLLPGLHKQVTTSWRKLYKDTPSSITSPYMKARISRTTMNSQEIEVSVEASKYGIFLVIFHKI